MTKTFLDLRRYLRRFCQGQQVYWLTRTIRSDCDRWVVKQKCLGGCHMITYQLVLNFGKRNKGYWCVVEPISWHICSFCLRQGSVHKHFENVMSWVPSAAGVILVPCSLALKIRWSTIFFYESPRGRSPLTPWSPSYCYSPQNASGCDIHVAHSCTSSSSHVTQFSTRLADAHGKYSDDRRLSLASHWMDIFYITRFSVEQ